MQAIEREILTNNWITITIIFSIILVFLMNFFYSNKLSEYSFCFFIKGFIEKETEENTSYFSLFNGLSFAFSMLTLSFFFYIQFQQKEAGINLYIVIFTILGSYIILRLFIDYLIVKLLGIHNQINHFIVTKLAYLFGICLWLFPMIIITLYGCKNNIILLIFFIFLIGLYFVLVFKNNKKLILSRLFYFILYICALEIAPLFILYKLIIK